jgi:hypothetical protein
VAGRPTWRARAAGLADELSRSDVGAVPMAFERYQRRCRRLAERAHAESRRLARERSRSCLRAASSISMNTGPLWPGPVPKAASACRAVCGAVRAVPRAPTCAAAKSDPRLAFLTLTCGFSSAPRLPGPTAGANCAQAEVVSRIPTCAHGSGDHVQAHVLTFCDLRKRGSRSSRRGCSIATLSRASAQGCKPRRSCTSVRELFSLPAGACCGSCPAESYRIGLSALTAVLD